MESAGKKLKCEFSLPSPEINPMLTKKMHQIVDEKISAWESKMSNILQHTSKQLEETKICCEEAKEGIKQELASIIKDLCEDQFREQNREIEEI